MAGLLDWFTDLVAERSASADAARRATEMAAAANHQGDPVARRSLAGESRNWASLAETLRGMRQ